MRRPPRALLAAIAPLLACATPRPLSTPAAAVQCRRMEAPRPWSYCLSREPDAGDNILYYLHGGNGGERSWNDRDSYTESLRRNWRARGVRPPLVATVSFGPLWLLGEKNSSPDSGLLEDFIGRVMPAVEAEAGGLKGKRLLLGESMGGFNAAQLLLRHGSLFERAALVCPGIADFSPHDAQALEDYIERTNADRRRVGVTVEVSKKYFPDAPSWRTASPLLSGKTSLGLKSPALYVSCGRSDEFGFFEGAKRFADLAMSRGAQAMWVPLDGGHCVADPESLAGFLVPR